MAVCQCDLLSYSMMWGASSHREELEIADVEVVEVGGEGGHGSRSRVSPCPISHPLTINLNSSPRVSLSTNISPKPSSIVTLCQRPSSKRLPTSPFMILLAAKPFDLGRELGGDINAILGREDCVMDKRNMIQNP